MKGRRCKPKRVLFLVGGTPRNGLSPSSRFRVFSYLAYLKREPELSVTISVSRPARSFHERAFFKRHRLLAPPIIAIGFALMFLTRLWDLARSPFYDAVFLQRPLFPGRPFPILELALCALNRRVVFDFDDAIFVDHHASGQKAPWKKVRLLHDPENVQRIVRKSAHVVAGNAFLADFARHHNANVSIVPTPIDTDHYTPAQPANSVDRCPVVGWIGTSGNLRYVEELAPVFRALQLKTIFSLHLVCNPVYRPLSLDGVHYRWIDWSLARERECLAAFDIGIMPLPDRDWERGKCGFKLLQYMACGIPAIASPVGINSRIIRDGENGCFAGDLPSWERAIASLVRDAELRLKIARNGRETVEREYSIRAVYPLLSQTLRSVAGS